MTLVELWYSTLVPIWRNSSNDVNRSAEFPLLSLHTFRYTLPTIFAARQQSCGKVMFSVLFVCHSVCQQGNHVTTVSWGPPPPQPRPWTPTHTRIPWPQLWIPGPVQIRSVCSPYIGRQDDDWHSTEMRSCLVTFLLTNPLFSVTKWLVIYSDICIIVNHCIFSCASAKAERSLSSLSCMCVYVDQNKGTPPQLGFHGSAPKCYTTFVWLQICLWPKRPPPWLNCHGCIW